ncbi:MAG: nucleotide sugar dehydrogenase [Actinomycetota bacterium]
MPIAQDPREVTLVGGAGHVGLPLSLAFANAGLRVGILDIDESALKRIGAGEMPFREAGADDLLRRVLDSGRLELSSDPEILGRSEAVVVVIGTPIDEFMHPSTTVFERVVGQLTPNVADGALVVLRSTVFPGTTRYVADALAEQGRRVDVAVCPERIAEGRALEELGSLPQIVGADEQRAGDRAAELFGRLGIQTVRTSSKEAELAKLFTNTWRYLKFAVANQFFMIAEDAQVDYNRVLDAIRLDYPRAIDLPGPGFAAGPCLLKDTMQLAAFSGDGFPMGHSAMLVNEGLPGYLVEAMRRRFGDLRGRVVGILGMAFKAESDDPRSSLSYKLRKQLRWAGARVLCSDPFVADDSFVSLEEALGAEIIVVGAPHQAYRGLDLGERELVDVWGVTPAGIRV